MTLCTLCRTIPLRGLSPFPETWEGSFSGNPERNQYSCLEEHTKPSHQPFGFPYHASLEALAGAANSCGICSLINESVNRFIVAYRKAQEDPSFVQIDRHGFPKSFQLWLTRRPDGADGILAFVYAASGKSLFLVGAVGFCVTDDSPLASVFRGRPIEEDAGAEIALKRAEAWVKNCVEKHKYCNRGVAPLPSRVLDLDSSSGLDTINLWETKGARGRYATLSHCWGDRGHFTTTRASIAERKEGIRLTELPKTFQDAVTVARRLKIRYLWIDSLCICQDDSEDWERESGNMAAIYTKSYLTIAATNAKNNSAGCFIPRPARRYIPIDFTVEDGTSGELLLFRLPLDKANFSQKYLEIADEPLTTRAWALQERAMAHRILHYCTEQMCYECNEEFLTEDGVHEEGRLNNLWANSKPVYAPLLRRSQNSAEHALWYRLVWDYTSRRLTKPSDKLPALSGLARVFADRIKAEYVAGLWSDALVEGLAWQGLGNLDDLTFSPLSTYIAPSWSWASYNGIAATGMEEGWEPIATILDYHVELKGENPYGEVKDGWIELRAPLVPVSLSDLPEKDGIQRNLRLKTPWGNPFGGYAGFDNIDQREESARALVRGLQLFALVLAQTKEHIEKYGVRYNTLIMTQDEGSCSGSVRMKRMGFVFLSSETMGNFKFIGDSAAFTIVTLV